jgi:hypothetical protein
LPAQQWSSPGGVGTCSAGKRSGRHVLQLAVRPLSQRQAISDPTIQPGWLGSRV